MMKRGLFPAMDAATMGIAVTERQPRPGWGIHPALAAVLAVCLVRLWLMPLASGFWVDEMATAFVVGHGANDPTLRVAPQVAESIYYGLPETSTRLLGKSEAAYRLPSELAMALALFLIFHLAGRLVHPSAGWFAIFACLSLRGFNLQAADARPYALGTAIACAALWFLIRWLDTARWLDGLAFAVLAALLWRVHLILWPLYLFYAWVAATRLVRGETAVRWGAAATVFGALGLSLLPVLGTALALFREAGAHVVTPPPSPWQLTLGLKLGLVAGPAAAVALIGRWRGWEPPEFRASWQSLSPIGGWWLGPPLCLFAFSWLTGDSVFVPRYLFAALPGAALAATAAIALFLPARYWNRLALGAGLAVLVSLGQWNRFWPSHQDSDWRGAARAISERLGPDVSVIAISPFVEARVPVWRPSYPIDSFLYCHLLVYRFPGKIYPFPFQDSPEVERYASQLSQQILAGAGKFAIHGGRGNVQFWREWFQAQPELAGWRNGQLGSFGDVEVVVFQKEQ